jgi:hypothetical protein
MSDKATAVTGTVTETTLLVPICYDSLDEPVRVPSASVEEALKAAKLDRGVLGFEFQQSTRVRLQPAEGGAEIKFSRRSSGYQVYMFADEVFGRADFAKLQEPGNPLSRYFNNLPKIKLADPNCIVYSSLMGLTAMDSGDQGRVTLVDRAGKQLFPKK